MKIVSKYKDFYDFFTHDYEADIVYVREPVKVYENYKKLYDKHDGYVSYSKYSYSKDYEGHVKFSNYIFGVFPYVYSQPVINVCVKSVTGYEYDIISTLSHKSITEFMSLKDNEQQKSWLLFYVNKMINDYVINHPYIKIPKNISLPWTKNKLSDYLSKFIWKHECREVFMKLNAPVWIEAYDELISQTVYFEYSNENKIKHIGNSTRYAQYITNICFNKLNENILKYWYNDLMDLNTYINIENFLWSVKQEPVSIPDNKTKIISHGFDLKTSFRKM